MANVEFGRDINKIGKGTGFHLPHDTAPVCLHGDLADAEFEGDLLV